MYDQGLLIPSPRVPWWKLNPDRSLALAALAVAFGAASFSFLQYRAANRQADIADQSRKDAKRASEDQARDVERSRLAAEKSAAAAEKLAAGMERSANAAETGARSGSQSLALSNAALRANIEASHNDQRAWVAVDKMSLTRLENGRPLTAEVTIVNRGKTVANGVHFSGGIVTSRVSFDLEAFERSKQVSRAPVPSAVIALFQNIEVTLPAETAAPLTSFEVEAIKQKRLLVCLFGEIKYKDIFEQAHMTQFCGAYVPGSNRFEACSQRRIVN